MFASIVEWASQCDAIDIFVGVAVTYLGAYLTSLAVKSIPVPWPFKRDPRRSVLLMGPSSSGKTSLFLALIDGQFDLAEVDAVQNVCEFRLNMRKVFTLIDTPGNPSTNSRYFHKYKASAKAIVYVIDASTIPLILSEVILSLIRLLNDNVAWTVPVLILCNKQDIGSALPCEIVRDIFRTELRYIIVRLRQIAIIHNRIVPETVFDIERYMDRMHFLESTVPTGLGNLKQWLAQL